MCSGEGEVVRRVFSICRRLPIWKSVQLDDEGVEREWYLDRYATKVLVRVEGLDDDRLLLHCDDDSTIEVEATGEQRRLWLKATPRDAIFDLVGPGKP